MSSEYLSLHMRAFRLCGIVHPLNAHPLVSLVHTVAFVSPIAVHLVLSLIFVVKFAKSSEVLTVNVVCTVAANLFKYYMYYTHAPEVRRLVAEITELARGDAHAQATHARCESRGRSLLAGFYFACVASGIFYVAGSLFGSRVLPMKAWYPFDTNELFQVALVMQLFMVACCNACVPVLDTFLPALLLHSCGQLDELARALRMIGQHSEHARADPINDEIESSTEVDDDQRGKTEAFTLRHRIRFVKVQRGAFGGLGFGGGEVEEEEYRRLLECVRWHQRILSFVRDVSNLFSPIIFVQLLSNSVVICLITFQITQHVHFDSVMLGEVLYLAVAMMQIGFFCFFGSELQTKGAALATAGYHTRWHERSVRFRKTLRMLMLRAQHPLVMVGGRFYEMTLHTFVAICRVSASYFSVLRQVTSDN